MNPATDPEHIAISRSKGIQIDWKDGHHSEYGLRYLRDQCPCATCTGVHGASDSAGADGAGALPAADNPFQMFKPSLKMLGAEPVGAYAIRINWSDGHNTGIYSYEHFRLICPCAECRGLYGGVKVGGA